VAIYQLAVTLCTNRESKAEFDDGRSHLIDHMVVLAWISGIVNQSLSWPVFEF
jgi:hypothetical protein